MIATTSLTIAASALALAASAVALPDPRGYNPNHPYRSLMRRAVTTDAASLNDKSFDFVVVGGGVAGLTVAARLAEWSNQTVLVIEAGGDGSDVELQQSIPGYTYHHGISRDSPYGWNYTTVPLAQQENAQRPYPLGRGLGGSGAVNGMFWGRAGTVEYDSWATLNPDGAEKWNSEEMMKYISKCETLQPPSQEQVDTFKIPVDEKAHGHEGPIQIGWSNYIYPVVANWIPTWQNMGFPVSDHSSGDPHGVTIVPSTMDASKGRRSSSRTAYLDNNDAPNLTVLTHHQATKIIFNDAKDASGNVVASGVQFQESADAPSYQVKANKEVIVSGGSVHSPKLLQLSGVGPASHLQTLGVKTVLDLPVGYNLQDHVAWGMSFNTVEGIESWGELTSNPELAAQALAEWQEKGTGKWTYVNEATGYISMSDIIAGGADGAKSYAANLDSDALVTTLAAKHNMPESVQAGMKAMYSLQKEWLTADVGQLEIIFHLWGSAPNTLGFQIALQHPFSRGTIMAQSTNAFDMPAINPDYFGANVDTEIMNNGAVWVRGMAKAKPMGDVMTGEAAPGENVTGEALDTYFKSKAGTEYHPIGTCAMLPKESGGVVDTRLIVYGTSNLRVVDSSIIPIHFSSHTMGSTYGVAERAADLIKKAQIPEPVKLKEDDKKPATETKTAAADVASAAADSEKAKSAAGVSAGVSAGVVVFAVFASLL